MFEYICVYFVFVKLVCKLTLFKNKLLIAYYTYYIIDSIKF